MKTSRAFWAWWPDWPAGAALEFCLHPIRVRERSVRSDVKQKTWWMKWKMAWKNVLDACGVKWWVRQSRATAKHVNVSARLRQRAKAQSWIHRLASFCGLTVITTSFPISIRGRMLRAPCPMTLLHRWRKLPRISAPARHVQVTGSWKGKIGRRRIRNPWTLAVVLRSNV